MRIPRSFFAKIKGLHVPEHTSLEHSSLLPLHKIIGHRGWYPFALVRCPTLSLAEWGPILGAFAPKVVRQSIVGWSHLNGVMAPNLEQNSRMFPMSYRGHQDACFEPVADHWGESAIRWYWGCSRGLSWRLPEQNIVEEVICAYPRHLVTIKW